MLLFSICLFCNHFKSFSLLSTKTNKKDLTSWLSSLFLHLFFLHFMTTVLHRSYWLLTSHSIRFPWFLHHFKSFLRKYTWRYIFLLSYLLFFSSSSIAILSTSTVLFTPPVPQFQVSNLVAIFFSPSNIQRFFWLRFPSRQNRFSAFSSTLPRISVPACSNFVYVYYFFEMVLLHLLPDLRVFSPFHNGAVIFNKSSIQFRFFGFWCMVPRELLVRWAAVGLLLFRINLDFVLTWFFFFRLGGCYLLQVKLKSGAFSRSWYGESRLWDEMLHMAWVTSIFELRTTVKTLVDRSGGWWVVR